MVRFFKECDGVVHGSSDIIEKDALELIEKAYGFKEQIKIGPFSYEMIEPPKDTSKTALEVEAFMNRALEESGPKSVFYVCRFCNSHVGGG